MKNKLVDVYIASLPRQLHVIKTAKSILTNPECGSLTISLSKKFTDDEVLKVKSELNDDRVKIYITDDLKGSNEKLKYIGDGTNPYIALIDDDCIYPIDYLNTLIKGCNKYNGHVSLHGVILNPRPIKSYYRDRQVFRGLGTVLSDKEVDISASCMTLFKRHWYQNLNEWYDLVGDTSMDDIYVCYFAMKKGIRRWVLAHKEGYVVHKTQYPEDEYVFDKHRYNDKIQTDFINEYFNV